MSVRWSLGLLAFGLLVGGCADLQELKIDARNKYLAREAWDDLQTTYGCMNYEKDFGRGFRDGYFDVAEGGEGCPPVLPPQRYWSARYREAWKRCLANTGLCLNPKLSSW